MLRFFFCLALLTAVTPALAENWDLRAMDIPLDYEQTLDLTAGRTLVIDDNGKSEFSEDGSFVYTYEDESDTTFGLFTVKRDGRVCIDYNNKRRRCDLFVRSGELLLMLTERGGRFPVRVQIGLKP